MTFFLFLVVFTKARAFFGKLTIKVTSFFLCKKVRIMAEIKLTGGLASHFSSEKKTLLIPSSTNRLEWLLIWSKIRFFPPFLAAHIFLPLTLRKWHSLGFVWFPKWYSFEEDIAFFINDLYWLVVRDYFQKMVQKIAAMLLRLSYFILSQRDLKLISTFLSKIEKREVFFICLPNFYP